MMQCAESAGQPVTGALDLPQQSPGEQQRGVHVRASVHFPAQRGSRRLWKRDDWGELRLFHHGVAGAQPRHAVLSKALCSVVLLSGMLSAPVRSSANDLPPMQARALDLQVDMQANQDRMVRNVNQLNGDFDHAWITNRTLKIHLRYTGPFDPVVKLEWAFIARDANGGLIAYDTGEKATTLTKRELVETVDSKELHGSESRIPLIHYHHRTGARPAGYVVRVLQHGHVLALSESIVGTVHLLDQELAKKSPPPQQAADDHIAPRRPMTYSEYQHQSGR
jgi:hypothetical protein